jgi:hypothetical protein
MVEMTIGSRKNQISHEKFSRMLRPSPYWPFIYFPFPKNPFSPGNSYDTSRKADMWVVCEGGERVEGGQRKMDGDFSVTHVSACTSWWEAVRYYSVLGLARINELCESLGCTTRFGDMFGPIIAIEDKLLFWFCFNRT